MLDFFIKPIWEYIRKSILGNKSIKEAMRTEKKRFFFWLMVMFSVACNVFFIPRVFTITKDYVQLRKENWETKKENIGLQAVLKQTQSDLANKTCPPTPICKSPVNPKKRN